MSRPHRHPLDDMSRQLRLDRQQLDAGARTLLGVSGAMYRTVERVAVVALLVYLIEIAQANPEWAIGFATLLLIGAESAERVLMSIGDSYDPRRPTAEGSERSDREK